jgi:hypothetical protein
MQIVAGALIGGVVIFAAIVLYLVDQNGPQGQVPAPGDLPILSIVALVMLGISVLLSLVLPNMILRGTMQRIAAGAPMATQYAGDENRLLQARQKITIVACALLEPAGMMASIAYLLEGQSFALTTAAVVVAFMLFQFPTQGRVRAWLEHHLTLVLELRQAAG